MLPFNGVVETLSRAIVRAIVEWRAGPETEESKALALEIAARRKRISRLEVEISMLERERMASRRNARAASPSWWATNKEALLVNVVGGLIYSVPLFILGIWIGKVIA